MRSLRMVAAVTSKEIRELARDPVTLGVAILLPLTLLFIFGYALRLDVKEAAMVVVDLDRTPASRQLAALFDRTEEFRVLAPTSDLRRVEELLGRGETRLALIIAEGFARDLERGRPVQVQILVDGSFSATARVIAGYADELTAAFSRARLAALRPTAPSLTVATRVWYNPSLDSVTSVVPGLFGVILMSFPPLLTALAVVREKERGTLRQILISPLPSWAFVLGKLVPYAVLAFVDLLLVLGAGMLLFGIPLRGNGPLLIFASVLYVLASLGIGLFVSTLARTQVVALLLVLVLTLMPAFMFSGFLYPIFTMPALLQGYTYLFPGRYFVALSRGIFLKGADFDVLRGNLALLALYAGLMVAVASWRLRAGAAGGG